MGVGKTRRAWTDEKRALAVKLCDEGMRVVDIGNRVDMSGSAVGDYLNKVRPGRSRPGSYASERSTIAARLAERDRLIASFATQRSITAEFFGDPLPGRSALDQKRRMETA